MEEETGKTVDSTLGGGYVPLLQPFWKELSSCERILIAGCGGGYDVFSGIPLFFALTKMGKTVSLASLSFTSGLQDVTGNRFGTESAHEDQLCVEVTADSARETGGQKRPLELEHYFPELFLSRWFREHENMEVPVYTFPKKGVEQTLDIYECLCKHLDLDCIILVDGGTDSLMTGNESELGTPVEDMTSIASVHFLPEGLVKKKFLACLGFGIDHFHGVCHTLFLENVAVLSQEGGYLGTESLLAQHEEAQKFLSAYHACQPSNSIVCSSVSSAILGKAGDHHHKATMGRTFGSKLFINPLMQQYWYFNLTNVANHVMYLDLLRDTRSWSDTFAKISKFRHDNFTDKKGNFSGREYKKFPH
eukprot:CAMPEP_0174256390 /NCGR_PEP_ID=MMETSP0439-20130205/5637_1 /TAXON_ID=0 /ORGANISM="Stereomyxa ramosa, Strain Chinc5" /LENGTH=361 /DNA_ID=CAMNT_0015338979 /DNA_START=291 /DNA_END=1376 /DNA_ORIENTATION=+